MVVLYRKYRPQKLSDLVGQEHVKETLLKSLEVGKLSHAYLFTGPKGTGKTTTARIIAKMLNCEKNFEIFNEPCNKCESCLAITEGSYLDVFEIDAASNRGIDDIRYLREKIKLAPAHGRYKVYIIDEVHMLTGEAFNALLKTLEEPPPHTVFILCTTEPKKIPDTIASRCQKFEFKKAKENDLVAYLKNIAKQEKIEVEQEALEEIAANSQGGFRDAVSIFDQIASSSTKIITLAQIKNSLSLSDEKELTNFLQLLKNKSLTKGLLFIKEYQESGKDIYRFVRDLILAIEQQMLILLKVNEGDLTADFSLEELKQLVNNLLKCESEMNFSSIQQLPLEILVMEWCGYNNEQVKPEKDGSEEVEEDDEVLDFASVDQDGLTLSNISTKWKDILVAVKPYNHSLESLLKKCEINDFDGHSLSLGVYYKLHKDVLSSPKNLKIIQDCIKEIMGEDIRVDLVLKVQKDLSSVAEEMFK